MPNKYDLVNIIKITRHIIRATHIIQKCPKIQKELFVKKNYFRFDFHNQ